MLVNECNFLLVGVIEVYFDVNDYKVPAQNVWARINDVALPAQRGKQKTRKQPEMKKYKKT